MNIHIVSLVFFLGCSTPEERTQRMLKELKDQQTPCSALQEGKVVPMQIHKGACVQGETMQLTLHRECTNGINIHNNALGWWTDEAIFFKGVPSAKDLVGCQWK